MERQSFGNLENSNFQNSSLWGNNNETNSKIKLKPILDSGTTPPPAVEAILDTRAEMTHDTLHVVFDKKKKSELKALPYAERAKSIEEISEREKEKRWVQTTGVKAEDSRFIYGCPIYNEINMGSSVLMLGHVYADIPKAARVDHVYVTNRCTDGSEKMVLELMGKVGEVKSGLLTEELGDLSFDPQIEPTYSMVENGNQRHIHLNTKTAGKANVLRILTELAIDQGAPIVISHDANVTPLPDAPKKIFAEAYKSFVLGQDNAVVISPEAPDYFRPGKSDPVLKGSGFSSREILPFGFVIPKEHKVQGKLFAISPSFFTDRGGVGIPPTKLDDVVMGKQAEKYGKTFRHLNEPMAYAWGHPGLEQRKKALIRYTTGYFQMANGLELAKVTPEIVFFNDPKYREEALRKEAEKNGTQEYVDLTIRYWNEIVLLGRRDYMRDPNNAAFEGIEGTK